MSSVFISIQNEISSWKFVKLNRIFEGGSVSSWSFIIIKKISMKQSNFIIIQTYNHMGLSWCILFNSTNSQLDISFYIKMVPYKLKCRWGKDLVRWPGLAMVLKCSIEKLKIIYSWYIEKPSVVLFVENDTRFYYMNVTMRGKKRIFNDIY